jgi:hypothetical protein
MQVSVMVSDHTWKPLILIVWLATVVQPGPPCSQQLSHFGVGCENNTVGTVKTSYSGHARIPRNLQLWSRIKVAWEWFSAMVMP